MRELMIGFFLLLLPMNFLHATRTTDLYLGPEIYHVKRTKEGGAEQTGEVYGVRVGYQSLKRLSFYYALDGLYSYGHLKGKNQAQKIQSTFCNSSLETRFGYTLSCKSFPYFAFTPFVGVGYIWEINRYIHPSPVKVKFENCYPYLPFGFLTSIHLSSLIEIGLQFTGRFLWNGKLEVKDPQYGTLSQCYEEHIQYRVELPINYNFCWNQQVLVLSLTPFYEYRHYGTSINFPFDFLDTKLKFFGANLKLHYRF